MFSSRSAGGHRQNALTLALERKRRAGEALLDLTRSNPTDAGLRDAGAWLGALVAPGALCYRPEPFGLPAAREAVAALMSLQGPHVTPDRVILTTSTSEAYGFLFKLLCDPGDQVLLPRPSYPLFEHLCRLECVDVAGYPLRYDGHWHLDRAALLDARSQRTRAIVTVHPNNPTGSYLSRDDLQFLAGLGLPLISDEVFAAYPLERDSDAATSAREARDALVFSLHGLSKLAGLPQLKLSWICVGGPDAQVAEALERLELIADTYLSVATPVQLALPAILERHGHLRDAIAGRLQQNLTLLRARCAGTGVSCLRSEGGWYAVLRVPAVMHDEAWALDLLEQAAVLVQPGYFYDFEQGPYLVISLLTPEAELASGLDRLLERVAALSSAL